jgi:RHS repeat-associated protein
VAVAPGAEPAINLGVGNPVHVATGNKYQKETDLPDSPAMPGLEIVRHYNALDTRASPLGRGWHLSYDTRLFHVGGRWQIVQADGSRIDFASVKAQPLPNAHGTLHADGAMWVWTWRTGRQLSFDSSGHLVRILAGADSAGARPNAGAAAAAPGRIDLRIERHAGPGPLARKINAIVDAQGHTLAFAYRIIGGQAYLDSIDTPVGRYTYNMDAQLRLAGMVRPDGMQRRYLYEARLQSGNTYALTGIETLAPTEAHAVRTNSWAYDAQGRATLSVRGPPTATAHRIELRYVRKPTRTLNGLTIVTDEKGRTTQFETALRGGRFVVTAVRGAGCAGCAAPGSTAAYDATGRLTQINGTHILRYPDGSIRRLSPDAPGWPQLSLLYRPDGRRISWSSKPTGGEQITYNSGGQPIQRGWANGDRVTYDYDPQGRPRRLVEAGTRASMETTLAWRGAWLAHVGHPHESEARDHDQHGRLTQRRVSRLSAHSDTRIHYQEAFEYDAAHRLIRHDLPEGGALAYRWGADNRLAGISWRDANGTERTVIDSTSGVPGYRYGNGLRSLTMLNTRGRAALMVVAAPGSMLWTQALTYDSRGQLLGEKHHYATIAHTEAWRYAYDTTSRMVGARVATGAEPALAEPGNRAAGMPTPSRNSAAVWYAWNGDGSLAALRQRGVSHRPSIVRDASGLASTIDGTALSYGPNRRLTRIERPTEHAADYFHNAYGHRIARRSMGANIDYYYLDNQLVAESTRRQRQPSSALGSGASRSAAAFSVTRRYIYAGLVPVGFIDYDPAVGDPTAGSPTAGPAHSQGRLFTIHADLIGAARMVTDATRTVRWIAGYDATGAAQRLAGDLDLDLRLPGQVFDAVTGWHDNIFRTYVPALGHYLEPDPLGPVPGSQAYGYAGQQPRRHADPLGLMLFAFDGTRNGPNTRSNVWKMSQTYRDGPVFYHSGPGTPLYVNWDAITGWQASRIIDTQWQSLLNALDQAGSLAQPLPIDILGYSRGAALARHFGNLINQHVDRGLFTYTDALRGLITACVDLRFMGLFDTVAQFGVAGSHNANYDLTVAAAWEWVAHAVALHERRWLFPLSGVADTNESNVIEAPFIGAHVDIGGGVLPGDDGPAPSGDLSDVTLNWMLWQAKAASAPFDAATASDRVVTDPILHDQRSVLLRSVQDGDRSVQTSGGSVLHHYQDDHARLGRTQRHATEAMIDRADDWRSAAGADVGHIDMSGYAQWLHDELGWSASLH